MHSKSDTPKIVGAVVMTTMVLVVAYFVLIAPNNDSGLSDSTTSVVVTAEAQASETATADEQSSSAQPVAEADTETAVTAEPATTYANGSYSAEKIYRVPEGHTESIAITVTVAADSVAELLVDTVASNGESAGYQAPFDERVIGEVSGKDLDAADLSRLGGASLTSNAFNDLLDAIRSEAAI